MAYKVSWHSNQRCVIFDVIEDLSKEEMYAACYELRDDIFPSVNHKVHIIVDLTKMKSYPQDLHTLTDATKIYTQHPNMGWIVVLGFDNPVAKFLANIMFQVSGARYKIASSLEEAQAILEKVDSTITG